VVRMWWGGRGTLKQLAKRGQSSARRSWRSGTSKTSCASRFASVLSTIFAFRCAASHSRSGECAASGVAVSSSDASPTSAELGPDVSHTGMSSAVEPPALGQSGCAALPSSVVPDSGVGSMEPFSPIGVCSALLSQSGSCSSESVAMFQGRVGKPAPDRDLRLARRVELGSLALGSACA
jgi:hypothetical protein